MDQQTVRPVMPIQSLPQGSRFFLGGGDNDQPEAAMRQQRREIAEPTSLVQVRDALAGHVVRRATQVNANQFQHLVLFVCAVGGIGQRRGKPRAPPQDFRLGQTRAWVFS